MNCQLGQCLDTSGRSIWYLTSIDFEHGLWWSIQVLDRGICNNKLLDVSLADENYALGSPPTASVTMP